MKVCLGGRVAEEVVLKEISTGASQDIQQASKIARGMITQYGMSDVLGPITYGEGAEHQVFLGRDFNHQRNYSEEVANEIDKEVRKYIENAYDECHRLIEENRDKLELIAQALMDRETLTADELDELVSTGCITDKPEDGTEEKHDYTPALKKLADTEEVETQQVIETELDTEDAQQTIPKFNVTRHA